MLTIFGLIVLLFSLVLHEVSHGWVALLLGDPTAKDEGRLTLNPLAHLDPVGSILVPLVLYLATAGQGPLFGWAKPVPINPYNFRDQKWGILKVSLAGPLSNFLVAVFFGLLIKFLPLPLAFNALLQIIVIYNLLWGFFNLVPIPPLDGSQILFSLLPARFGEIREQLSRWSPFLLLFFIFFGFRFLNFFVFKAYSLLVG
ncbi:MAG: site-2 protease family protein [Candidatus Nealsonbacteria bacterium]|nr:site-2 protease family protein [Candidatus Nealsonbacteria bacterium]